MSKKRILLVNPVQNHPTKNMYPSGALLLIGTMCKESGHHVKLYEGTDSLYGLYKQLESFKPDVVGITINTFQTKYAAEYIDYIKAYDKNIKVIVGGPHISAIGLKAINTFHADTLIIGEGEFAFLDLVYMDIYPEKVEYHQTKSLNHIPLTDLSLIYPDNYIAMSNGHKSMFIMASRGCPFGCTYCNKSVFGSSVRFREPIKIIEEIKHLHFKYGINHVYFQDDTFNLKRDWINEILKLIIHNRLNKDISYMAPFRVDGDLLDIELLYLAKKANFKNIFYGVESGNQDMLDRMRKGTNISEIVRAFDLTYFVGIDTTAAFIFGLPGETVDTIRDTIELWSRIKPTHSGFTIATPFPNTQFEKEVSNKGHIVNSNYNQYRCGGSYIKTDDLTTKELEYYSNVATYGASNEWIYQLPVFKIGKNKISRTTALQLINIFKKVVT